MMELDEIITMLRSGQVDSLAVANKLADELTEFQEFISCIDKDRKQWYREWREISLECWWNCIEEDDLPETGEFVLVQIPKKKEITRDRYVFMAKWDGTYFWVENWYDPITPSKVLYWRRVKPMEEKEDEK